MGKPGFLEKFNFHAVGGWVPKLESNNTVRLVFNDDIEMSIKANIHRSDLGENGVGFEFLLTDELKLLPQLKVHAFLGETEIDNSPRQIVTNCDELSKVIEGRDGYLYLRNDANNSLGYITGEIPVDRRTITLWGERISERNQHCKELGITYTHLISPEKEVVYKDKLPENFTVTSTRPVNSLIDELKSINTEEVLYSNYDDYLWEEDFPAFSKGDTHWTYHGALHMTQILIKSLSHHFKNITPPRIEDYQFKHGYQASDLLVKTSGVNVEKVAFATKTNSGARCVFDNNLSNTGRRLEYINKREGDMRLMAYHTSSIDWMMPFLNETFGAVCYIWGQSIDWSEVLRYNPHILLLQSNERFLRLVPNDTNWGAL